MPHSSGGGSHGGGSHGGSGFHGGSGGGTRQMPRTSSRYFVGCHAYVYYRHNRPYYVYSDQDLRSQPNNKYRWLTLLFFIPFIVVLAIIITNMVIPPKKITTATNYNAEIIDNISTFDSTTALKEQLDIFKEKTGIPVTILTVNRDSWYSHYYNLEQYAYDQYVSRFHTNEDHWLIVYSYKDDGGFSNWAFEGMQGNDTDAILTENITDLFTKQLDSNLRDNSLSVASAFTNAFVFINGKVMKVDIQVDAIIGISFMAIFILGMFTVVLVSLIKNNYNYSELKEVNGKPETVTCAYCQGQYAKGVHTQCPHCGASVVEEPNFDI